MSFTRIDRNPPAILVVDDDPLLLTATGAVLNMHGYAAVLARNEAVAARALADRVFDVLILSIDEPQAGCLIASRLLQSESARDMPVIFLTPRLDTDWTDLLAQHGGVFSMLKPIDPSGLIDLVEQALWLPHIARGRGNAPPGHLSTQRDWIKLSDV